jgi:hypothetical protein
MLSAHASCVCTEHTLYCDCLSQLQELIPEVPEVISSKKFYINMRPIHDCFGRMGT